MPKVTAAVAALLLALTLTGCGGDDAPDAAPGGEARGFVDAAETASPAPTHSASETPLRDEDIAFLAYVRADLVPQTTTLGNATDHALIDAGHEACDQISQGVKLEDLRLVPGEHAAPSGSYYDTSSLFNGALVNYCPELMEERPAG